DHVVQRSDGAAPVDAAQNGSHRFEAKRVAGAFVGEEMSPSAAAGFCIIVFIPSEADRAGAGDEQQSVQIAENSAHGDNGVVDDGELGVGSDDGAEETFER